MTGTKKAEDGASPQPKVTVAEYVSAVRKAYGDMTEEFMTLYPASSDQEAGEQANASARDRSRTSTFLWATEWAKTAKSPVLSYFWTHPVPGADAGIRGAYHGSEINYIFNNLYATDRPWTDVDRRIADTLSRYVVNFAATGDPNGEELPAWPAAAPEPPVTMEIGESFGPIPVADQCSYTTRSAITGGLDHPGSPRRHEHRPKSRREDRRAQPWRQRPAESRMTTR